MTTPIPVLMPQNAETIAGNIIANHVSLEDFEKYYAEDFCEWVEGYVIKMSSNIEHDALLRFFSILLATYLELRPIARFVQASFMMKNPAFPNRRREPDLVLVLNTSATQIQPTFVDGAADIIIEIVSPESVSRDYGEKFEEYETGGVREYWIFDPQRQECRFHRLNAAGLYQMVKLADDGRYTTPLLPDFVVDTTLLWQDPLPGPIKIVEIVKLMVSER